MHFALRPHAHIRTTRRGRSRIRFTLLALGAFVTGLAFVGSAGYARPCRADAALDAALDATPDATPASSPDPVPAALTFRARSQPARVLSLRALTKACGEQRIEVDDPYHGRRMRYRAIPLRCVLDQGFASRGGAASLANESLLLRARDGYTRPASGKQLDDPRAFLAFGEPGLEAPRSGRPRFRPIDRRQIDPAPFYLVWTGRRERRSP